MIEEKASYKTGYQNPKCKNRENEDCSKGNVLLGLCENCSYKLSPNSKKNKKKPKDWLKLILGAILVWVGITVIIAIIVTYKYLKIKLLG